MTIQTWANVDTLRRSETGQIRRELARIDHDSPAVWAIQTYLTSPAVIPAGTTIVIATLIGNGQAGWESVQLVVPAASLVFGLLTNNTVAARSIVVSAGYFGPADIALTLAASVAPFGFRGR